jgi:hypothetical protein
VETHVREDCQVNKLLEHPEDCTKMLVCTDERLALVKKCNRDHVTNTQLFFSEENQWCDFLENVDCGNRLINPKDTSLINKAKKEKPAKMLAPDCLSSDCVNSDGKMLAGDHWLPMAECGFCACRCHFGRARRICCRRGTMWSNTKGMCDWPSNIRACGPRSYFGRYF